MVGKGCGEWHEIARRDTRSTLVAKAIDLRPSSSSVPTREAPSGPISEHVTA